MQDRALTLEELGWSAFFAAGFAPFQAQGLEPARVSVEDKHRYILIRPAGELPGQISGKLLHLTPSASDLPKVGDWVAASVLPNEPKAVIHHVLPRRTKFSRKAAGREVGEQVLAANVDVAFVVQGLDRPFNAGLLQRHLLMAYESGAEPVVVLNKTDLREDAVRIAAEAQASAGNTAVIALSAKTGESIDRLAPFIRPGRTVVFLGSSGVGKSTLINQLYGKEIQATAEVRESDSKGRHTTTWRELIVLPEGGLVIDTPGMREFHIWLAGEGVHEAFPEIEALAARCQFRDCAHTVETRCAVREAVERGGLPRERFESYLKLQRELTFLEQAQHDHAFRERKREAKIAQRAFNKLKRGDR